MSVEDRLYLENLEEYVIDENRVVTYKWLSRTLSVNVNQAKRMLFEFVTEQRAKKSDNILNVIYMVSGLKRDSPTAEITQLVTLVSEDQLDKVKQGLQPVTSVHVYSVQKFKPKDLNVLYTADYELQRENLHESNKWSCITCKEAELLPDGKVDRRRTGVLANGLEAVNGIVNNGERRKAQSMKTNEASFTTTSKSNKTVLNPFEKMAARASSKKADVQCEQHKDLTEEGSVNRKTVASFFGRQPARKQNKDAKLDTGTSKTSQAADLPSQHDTKAAPEKELEKTEKATNFKASFSGKQQTKRTKNIVGSKSLQPLDSLTPDAKECDKMESSTKPSNQQTSLSVIPETPKADIREQGRKRQKQSKKSTKRRRTRVLAMDSDSGEETCELKQDSTVEDNSNPESRDPVEEESAVLKPASPLLKHLEKPRRKRIKKLVSKTYVNEQDEFITEKVYESCSTDASDVEVVKTETMGTQKKALSTESTQTKHSPQQKTTKVKSASNKQSNLMSYFHRPK
ncbi:DNA polymerase delta subunit 3-like isoform X2 [Corticium candelabrum]|uniref:DNA polymerase delta subunit 3-like isoform X2 n=1 Tax=Corticium candelabrum TaxID=121492 RepID=UPI002E262F88|nr:DNA polymerase delta subunit 3-like isoform X2 [Corticium candelabrum]